MDDPAQKLIRVERETGVVRGLVVGGGELGEILSQLLKQQNLQVEKPSELSPDLLGGVKYVFFFFGQSSLSTDWKSVLQKLLEAASRGEGKVVVILDNMPRTVEEEMDSFLRNYGRPFNVVSLNGWLGPESNLKTEAMGKVVRIAFSSRTNEKISVMGKAGSYDVSSQKNFAIADEKSTTASLEKQYYPKIIEIPGQTSLEKKVDREIGSLKISSQRGLTEEGRASENRNNKGITLILIVLLILSPLFFLTGETVLGFWGLYEAKQEITEGNFQSARESAKRAEQRFFEAQNFLEQLSGLAEIMKLSRVLDRGHGLLRVGKLSANSLYRLTIIQPIMVNLPRSILGDGESIDWDLVDREIELEALAIDENLGMIEAEWNAGKLGFVTKLTGLAGFDEKKLESYFEKIPKIRRMIHAGRLGLLVLPEIVGKNGRKTYLMVFQNSTELRATGGFIGSYAIVHMDGGKLLDYKINDIYTADGQLKGRVSPPDEILHFLGQPNWYMRDANFAADFPLSAKRLEWFLERETGQSVDGVIAINLGAVQKILSVVGGVKIDGEKDKITGENFFEKAEYAAEINFFPGSTQKKDFLGSVGEAILAKVTGAGEKNWMLLGQAFQESLDQKDILFYFNSTAVQSMVIQNGWGGGIRDGICLEDQNDCFMIVESNFGANKSNYFVKRSLSMESTIDKGGGIVSQVTLNLRNESPNESWPGGKYKNYLRFLLPMGSRFVSMDLGDERVATVSPSLTEKVLSKVQKNQFLVVTGFEPAVVGGVATTSGYLSLGTLVEVPVAGNRVVTMEFVWPKRLDFSLNRLNQKMTFLKQPGNEIDFASVTINYPSFLKFESPGRFGMEPSLASEQKLVYNMGLSQDKTINVWFDKD